MKFTKRDFFEAEEGEDLAIGALICKIDTSVQAPEGQKEAAPAEESAE